MASLNNFDPEDFLRNHWQKSPLLIHQGLDNTEALISPDELAGLACETEMESRLVSYQQQKWQLRHGPFSTSDLSQLPNGDWTLLVQAVDHVNPAVAELMDSFRFIPNWQLDDIMVSYAREGGSVGPHFDNYDVFLVQTSGQREWQLGQRCDESDPLIDHPDLLLLDNFECEQRFVLNPGDILYIPPRYGHWGIAKDNNCITCSVGFRSPTVADIIAEYAEHLGQSETSQQHFQDQTPQLQENPGEIGQHVVDQLSSLIVKTVDDQEALGVWFGQYMTQAKYEHEAVEIIETEQGMTEKLLAGYPVFRDSATRLAYIPGHEQTKLFCNGFCWQLDSRYTALAKLLCGQTVFNAEDFTRWLGLSHSRKILIAMFEKGQLYFDDD
jgi:50S ribosomal protein L16 3-hydroxylase